ncbi:P4Hc domain-containing protein [Mycena kentingensis (nom. inval.)]|nr:P4Hc domain-containing protein [Mycena kentingensis (nom. inval.)]
MFSLSLNPIRRLVLRRKQPQRPQRTLSEKLGLVPDDEETIDDDDDDTLCELPSERFDGFVLFRVENTVFKVHTSLLRLARPSSRSPTASDAVAKPILRVPGLSADDFRLFLWDLNALSHHLGNPGKLASSDAAIHLSNLSSTTSRILSTARGAPKYPTCPQVYLLQALQRILHRLRPRPLHSPPPLPLPHSNLLTHDHTVCERAWEAIWATAGEWVLVDLPDVGDVVPLMGPHLQRLLAEDSMMPMECALAALEAVGGDVLYRLDASVSCISCWIHSFHFFLALLPAGPLLIRPLVLGQLAIACTFFRNWLPESRHRGQKIR